MLEDDNPRVDAFMGAGRYGRGVNLTSGLLVRGLRSRDLYVLDALLAAVLAFACGLSAVETPASGGWHEPGVVTVLTGLLIGLPLAVRRLLPLPVTALSLVISAGALVSGVITDYASGSVVVVLAFELYLVGAAVAAWSITTLVVTLVVLAVALMLAPGSQGSVMGTAFACVVVAGAWLLGWIRRERRQHVVQVAEQRTQRAVGDERLRIARELHDIVAHSMSLIAVRAGVADHVFEVRPQEARAALRDIEVASRSALGQLRQVVEVLREEDGLYEPMPGLGDLQALADRAAAGGISVRLTVVFEPRPGAPKENGRGAPSGERPRGERPQGGRRGEDGPGQDEPGQDEPGQDESGQDESGQGGRRESGLGEDGLAEHGPGLEVPEAVGLSAYRIVQEALTNAVKHAAPAACAVTVTVTPAEVRIRVVDGGPGVTAGRAAGGPGATAGHAGGGPRAAAGPADGGGGHGLIGMRERVAAWGGEFSAGPGDAGGFVVTATLPYRAVGS